MFEFFKRRDHTATIAPGGQRLLVKAGDKLLNAALAAGLDWPHDCRVGSCGTCRCLLTDGRIKPLTDFSYTLEPSDLQRGYILACQSRLQSDIVVEVALGTRTGGALEHQRGRIVVARRLTHDILEVELELAPGAFAGALAGQYADVTLSGRCEPRSYSFAERPAASAQGRVRFFIRHVPGGAFTDWLFEAERIGTELELDGPYGAFHYRQASGRMVCIAGGSGLAPIHALLKQALQDGVTRDCVVMFGARATRDLYYLDELAALGRAWHGPFTLLPVLSEEPPGSPWTGARGLVTEQLPAMAGAGFADTDQGYLCGPPPMVDAGIARLISLGMHEEAIFCDKFLDASTQPGGRGAIAAA